MMVFAGSEVGSARALLPICYHCVEQNIPFVIIARGYFLEITDPVIQQAMVKNPESVNQLVELLTELSASVVIFSVNTHDPQPLSVARTAAGMGLPTLHVLDFWHGYSARMKLDGMGQFVPSQYVVPDEIAAKHAVQEGTDPDIIQILGQPAFYDAPTAYTEAVANPGVAVKEVLSSCQDKSLLLFVSEPIVHDQGESLAENPNYRGYTEKEVLSILVQSLQHSDAQDKYHVCVLPHPREDVLRLRKLWDNLGGQHFGTVVSHLRGRDLLPYALGVIGMSSTLLYEAWLVGVPVLSIQPQRLDQSEWMMTSRENAAFIDQIEGAVEQTADWLAALAKLDTKHETEAHNVREDVKRHQTAPENICTLAFTLVNEQQAEQTVKATKV